MGKTKAEIVEMLRGGNIEEWNVFKNMEGPVDLRGSDLSYSDLSYSNLSDSNLSGSNLRGSDLSDSNLSDSDLRGSNLSGSNLRGSKVSGVYWPSPTMILLADWGECTDYSTLLLMRYDADNHPDPRKFMDWANGGNCPYADEVWQRAANFKESAELLLGLGYEEFMKLPVHSALVLAQMLIKEHCKE